MTNQLPAKVLALYEAVGVLMAQGENINNIKVADITRQAGIGKGTAYEYFSNKEELISSAILFQISRICTQTMEHMGDQKGLRGCIWYILDCMDKEIQDRDCLLRFIHLLSDTGSLSQLLQKKAKEQAGSVCMPEDLVQGVIEMGKKSGDIGKGLADAYVALTITSKIITYIFYVNACDENQEFTREEIKGIICDSLLKELK